MFKLFGMRTLIIGICLVAGIIVGVFGSGYAIATTSIQDLAPVYQRNDSGQTYGSALNVTSQDKMPNLVLAIGVDGTVGYLQLADFMGELPKNPEEALAQQNKLESNAKAGIVQQVPLYAADGKTIIGAFNIDNGMNPDELVKLEVNVETD